MAKILRKSYENHKAQFSNLGAFGGQKMILHHFYTQNARDGTHFEYTH